ncbi:response regulator [bacterium]|nr:response regulator [bacterium]
MRNAKISPINILLLIKDPEEIARLRVDIAKVLPASIRQTDSVDEALIMIEKEVPDLVITEWILRDNPASKLLMTIDDNPEWRGTPVLVCASTRSQQLKLRAKHMGAFGFLQKPINHFALNWHLSLLFTTDPAKRRVTMSRHEEKSSNALSLDRSMIGRIKELAPLPKLAYEIVEKSSDPNAKASDLAKIISHDLALASKILKVVNSAFYGFHRKIGNIDRAVVILGFREIVNIAQAACLMQSVKIDLHSDFFNQREFWKHSLCTAYIAQALSRKTKDSFSKEAFIMGLLHDFGKVILIQHFKDLFEYVIGIAIEKEESLHSVSRRIIEIDHAEIGGMITEAWGLPKQLVNAVSFHHDPMAVSPDNYEVHLIHLANYMAHHYGVGVSGNPKPDPLYTGSLEALRLQGREMDDIWKSLRINVNNIDSMV